MKIAIVFLGLILLGSVSAANIVKADDSKDVKLAPTSMKLNATNSKVAHDDVTPIKVAPVVESTPLKESKKVEKTSVPVKKSSGVVSDKINNKQAATRQMQEKDAKLPKKNVTTVKSTTPALKSTPVFKSAPVIQKDARTLADKDINNKQNNKDGVTLIKHDKKDHHAHKDVAAVHDDSLKMPKTC